MATALSSFETGHSQMIHDSKMDYYGRRVATASSDRSVKIFDTAGGHNTCTATLMGHEGPVWQVAWAHPKYGSMLASCGYDRRVIVWNETERGWVKVFVNHSHSASVNSLAFAPYECGLVLAVGSADGYVSIFSYNNGQWSHTNFEAHPGGVNSVSWSPALPTGSLLEAGQPNAQQQKPQPVQRLVTGGCDNNVFVWTRDESGKWSKEQQPCFDDPANKHQDWVRCVAWAPSLGLPTNTIASCSEDKTVKLWTESANQRFKLTHTLQFDHKVWSVDWSLMGNILAVAQGDNKVTLWKESLSGEWQQLTDLDDGGMSAFQS